MAAENNKKRKPTRAERIAAAAAARRKRQLQVRAAIAAGVAVVVGITAFIFVSDRRDRDKLVKRFESGACAYDTRSDRDQGPGRNHLSAAPAYSVDPPAGGDHLVEPVGPGVYTPENLPPDGRLVHSLEHGYVILWYKPGADEATTKMARDIFDRHNRDVLVVPRVSLPVPVAATAWHDRLLCKSPDSDALDLFVKSFANKGPEKIAH